MSAPRVAIRTVADADFVSAVASEAATALRTALADRPVAWLALSGGRTPGPILASLAADFSLPWDRIGVAFIDDRCVPPTDPASNYAMVARSLLDTVSPHEVLRIRGELPPAEAAERYRAELAASVGTPPTLDVALIGFGPDGHIASLFGPPESHAGLISPADSVLGGDPFLHRVTLTADVLAGVRHGIVFGRGAGKAEVLSDARDQERSDSALAAYLAAAPSAVAIIGLENPDETG